MILLIERLGLYMVNQDMITDLVLKLNIFISKKGRDINNRNDVIHAINTITGEDSLDMIYISNISNFNIPEVVVLPLYHTEFADFVMNPDTTDTCPFGYTIEINSRVFDKLTAEELTAVILHDILQNVQSDTAKIRFMKAYQTVLNQYPTEMIVDAFNELSLSEVTFMAYMEICCRPFRVPASGDDDFTGTDSTLKVYGLADAYDSYLEKILPMSNDDPDDRINGELENDVRDMTTIIKSCLDKDIRHYYTMIRNGVPLISLEHILGNSKSKASLGFISRRKTFKHRYPDPVAKQAPISETIMNPKSEIEIRFQIDKIISEIRYAETEAEGEVVLFKIKQLRLKLFKTLEGIEKKLQKLPGDKVLLHQKETILNFDDELDALRNKVVNMEIKQKVWRIYSKQDMPEGYRF